MEQLVPWIWYAARSSRKTVSPFLQKYLWSLVLGHQGKPPFAQPRAVTFFAFFSFLHLHCNKSRR